jgi:hypothetical protein
MVFCPDGRQAAPSFGYASESESQMSNTKGFGRVIQAETMKIRMVEAVSRPVRRELFFPFGASSAKPQ